MRLEGGTSLQFSLVVDDAHCNITSSADLLISRKDGKTTVSLAPAATCSGDVVMRVDSRQTKTALRAYSDGERTLVVVHPPREAEASLQKPCIASFVLDRSSSMEGERLDAAKRAITTALQALRESDAFEILAFDNSTESFSESPCVASIKHVKKAIAWLMKIEAQGGTHAHPALLKACTTRVAPGFVRTVLFVTDGDVGNDQEILDVTNQFDPATRLFVLGIGMAPSHAMLSRLARLGGGSYLALKDDDDIEAEMDRFRLECNGPLAMDIREVGATASVRCDLFAGRSSSFFIEGAREEVNIESSDGTYIGKCAVLRASMDLGSIWARGIIEHLEDRVISDPSSRKELEENIAQLGVKHRLLTRFTSFVAVDEQSNVHGEPISIVQPTDRIDDQCMDRSIMYCKASPMDLMECAERSQPPMRPRQSRMARIQMVDAVALRSPASRPNLPHGFTPAPTGRRALDWSKEISPSPSVHHAIQILYWGVSSGEGRTSPLFLQIIAIFQAAIDDSASSGIQVAALEDLLSAIYHGYEAHDEWERAAKAFPQIGRAHV